MIRVKRETGALTRAWYKMITKPDFWSQFKKHPTEQEWLDQQDRVCEETFGCKVIRDSRNEWEAFEFETEEQATAFLMQWGSYSPLGIPGW